MAYSRSPRMECPMIDRQARDKALQLLTSYMDGSISENINWSVFELEQETHDELISLAGHIIWQCTDRGDSSKPFEGNRNVWNLLCRIKLLLMSNADVKVRKVKRGNIIQPIAIVSWLVLFPLLVYVGSLQNGTLFWSYMFLSGLWTWFLSRKHARILERFNREEARPGREPFESFAELLAVRRSVPAFRKPPFPVGVPERLPDQEESLGPFARICNFIFLGFIYFMLWFGPLLQLAFRNERVRYEFRLPHPGLRGVPLRPRQQC